MFFLWPQRTVITASAVAVLLIATMFWLAWREQVADTTAENVATAIEKLHLSLHTFQSHVEDPSTDWNSRDTRLAILRSLKETVLFARMANSYSDTTSGNAATATQQLGQLARILEVQAKHAPAGYVEVAERIVATPGPIDQNDQKILQDLAQELHTIQWPYGAGGWGSDNDSLQLLTTALDTLLRRECVAQCS